MSVISVEICPDGPMGSSEGWYSVGGRLGNDWFSGRGLSCANSHYQIAQQVLGACLGDWCSLGRIFAVKWFDKLHRLLASALSLDG